MTAIVVTDEQLDQLGRKYHDLSSCVRGGTLSIERALGVMQDLIDGNFDAILQSLRRLINCDAKPYLPDDWSIEPEDQIKSGVRGEITFDPAKVVAHFVYGQKNGQTILGFDLKKLLEGRLVLPANVLDYLFANTNLIPDSWKIDEKGQTRHLYFWGTIYRASAAGMCVRYLYWDGGEWCWNCRWLGDVFDEESPSALLAS